MFLQREQWAVRPKDIRRAMLDVSPKIVHFSGHGVGEEGLAFENDVVIRSFQDRGGEIKQFAYDPESETANIDAIIDQAAEWGADGILLAPHVNDLEPAIEVAIANLNRRQPLALFGSASLYIEPILKEGRAAVDGLILSVPWHRDVDPENPFLDRANQLWGGTVNWRTALSYDATLAIAEGLKKSDTRDGLAKELRQEDFKVSDGTNGEFNFTQAGDRSGNPVLIQVVPNEADGYTFKLLDQ